MDSTTVTVGATPTLIADQGGHIAPLVLLVSNVGAQTVWLGASDVDSTGYPLPAGASRTVYLFIGDRMYGVVASGSCDVSILETLAEQGHVVMGVPELTQVLGQGNDAGGDKITGLGDPTADGDAATKSYTDAKVATVPVTHVATVAGAGAATPIVVTGIKTTDTVLEVLRFTAGALVGSVKSHTTLPSTGHIQVSDNTTGDTLVVLWSSPLG